MVGDNEVIKLLITVIGMGGGITAAIYAVKTYEYTRSEKLLNGILADMTHIYNSLLPFDAPSNKRFSWFSAKHSAETISKTYHKLHDDHKEQVRTEIQVWEHRGIHKLFKQPIEFYIGMSYINYTEWFKYDVDVIRKHKDSAIPVECIQAIWDLCMFTSLVSDTKTDLTWDSTFRRVEPDDLPIVDAYALQVNKGETLYRNKIKNYFRVVEQFNNDESTRDKIQISVAFHI